MGRKCMKRGFFVIVLSLSAIIVRPFVALAETDTSYDAYERKEKVRELCERQPNLPKCEKFLDSEYRRYSDLEKDSDANKELEEIKLEQLNQREAQNELYSFCKEEPDAPRCQKLKSRPGLKHSFRTSRR
jgi:hypothetical protein